MEEDERVVDSGRRPAVRILARHEMSGVVCRMWEAVR
jgi:hypothetical protein